MVFEESTCRGCGQAGVVCGDLCEPCMVERYTGEVSAATILILRRAFQTARTGQPVTIASLEAFEPGWCG